MITKEQYERALEIINESLKSAPPISIHDPYIGSRWKIVEEYERTNKIGEYSDH